MSKPLSGILDETLYESLAEIWVNCQKINKRPQPTAKAFLDDFSADPLHYLGKYQELITSLRIDASNWLYPVAVFPVAEDPQLDRQSVRELSQLNLELCQGLIGNKLIILEGSTFSPLCLIHHLYRAEYYFLKYNEPLKLSKIRFSATHLLFGEYLFYNYPHLPHDERTIRAFFRVFKKRCADYQD